jgi:predicted transposase/invertase (TIGR01784 family)
MTAKYINPFTDFGFKKLFGEEASKISLIDFLNSLLTNAHIKDLSFKNTEQLRETVDGRKVIYDIYCENEQCEKFIVEMQKARQNFFKERTIYYSTFPIREQVEKDNFRFDLKAVYCVGILDFTFNDYTDESEKGQIVHEIKLKNQHGKTFYDKLTYVYLEMPNFTKQESALTTRLDKWLYFIQHLADFQAIPDIFRGDVVFIKAFEKAELSSLTQREYTQYEDSLKTYVDWQNVIGYAVDTAVLKAVQQVEQEKELALQQAEKEKEIALEQAEKEKELALEQANAKAEKDQEIALRNTAMLTAKRLKDAGIEIEIITRATGLTLEEISNL